MYNFNIDWGDGITKEVNITEGIEKDGVGITGSSIYSYSKPGVYTATLCITSADGYTGCDDLHITVLDSLLNGNFDSNSYGDTPDGEVKVLVSVDVNLKRVLSTDKILIQWGDGEEEEFAIDVFENFENAEEYIFERVGYLFAGHAYSKSVSSYNISACARDKESGIRECNPINEKQAR